MTRGKIDLSAHQHAKRTMPTRRHAYSPVKPGHAYAEIWRVVDGAVRDAFATHPEYIQKSYLRAARFSINKRVTGAVNSYVARAAQGRPSTVPDMGERTTSYAPPTGWQRLAGALALLGRSAFKFWGNPHEP